MPPLPAPSNPQGDEDEDHIVLPPPPKIIPPHGTLEWIQYVSETDGLLPTPIPVSITGSEKYYCPELKWFNFDVYPHKIKMTNTGYTVLIGAKWKTERPYITGGPFLEKHVFSQIHFHWGDDMREGSDHIVDNRKFPGEMQVTFFKSEYLTQEEALLHPDGVCMFCYLITQGIEPDPRLQWIVSEFKKIKESKTHIHIGPRPLSDLIPMFYEDYFLYWGSLHTVKGDDYVTRWLIPRCVLSATDEQMAEFRKLWDPWDEPMKGNNRPPKPRKDRTVFFISPHWSQYNSLLPLPRSFPEPSISVLSPEYLAKPWMLPPQNADMIPKEEVTTEKRASVASAGEAGGTAAAAC